MAREPEPDLHAAARERRQRHEREGMRVHGRGVRRLAELSTRPGHVSRLAKPAAAKRRPVKRRRGKGRR